MIRFLELTKNLQFGAKTIMQNLPASFIFQKECRMKIEHVLFPSGVFFFKITDPCDVRSFLMCSHDPFFGTNKNRILRNGSYEQTLRERYLIYEHCSLTNLKVAIFVGFAFVGFFFLLTNRASGRCDWTLFFS